MDAEDKLTTRRIWRLHLLASIREIADLDEQRREWLDYERYNPHFSFIEYSYCFIDGLQTVNGYHSQLECGTLNSLEVDAVLPLHALMLDYHPHDPWNHDAILADPKWLTIVDAAKQAQGKLAALLSDKREIRALLIEDVI